MTKENARKRLTQMVETLPAQSRGRARLGDLLRWQTAKKNKRELELTDAERSRVDASLEEFRQSGRRNVSVSKPSNRKSGKVIWHSNSAVAVERIEDDGITYVVYKIRGDAKTNQEGIHEMIDRIVRNSRSADNLLIIQKGKDDKVKHS